MSNMINKKKLFTIILDYGSNKTAYIYVICINSQHTKLKSQNINAIVTYTYT